MKSFLIFNLFFNLLYFVSYFLIIFIIIFWRKRHIVLIIWLFFVFFFIFYFLIRGWIRTGCVTCVFWTTWTLRWGLRVEVTTLFRITFKFRGWIFCIKFIKNFLIIILKTLFLYIVNAFEKYLMPLSLLLNFIYINNREINLLKNFHLFYLNIFIKEFNLHYLLLLY